MSNNATRDCEVCGSPYQIGAVRCERGHVLPRQEAAAGGHVLPQPEAAAARVGGEANADLAHDLFAFDGRIGRQKFWLMGMVISLATVAFTVFARFVSSAGVLLSGDPQLAVGVGALLFWGGAIAALWMYLAVWAKRWHDRGKSGWWSLIMLIPVIGWVWTLVELGFLQGDYGDNKYGRENVSSAETVAKWTFWAGLTFAVVMFSVGTWVADRDEPLVGLGAVLYALYVQYGPLTVQLLAASVGSLIIWRMSRR